MNSLVVPPSPNWYETDVAACAPDNTLLYGARNDLVVIKPGPSDQPDNVKIINKAHNARVVSVNINKNWGQPNKLAVTVSEDKIVKLWDIETLEKKLSHNKHLAHEPVRGVAFAGDDRVISVSENGIIVVWNIVHNETNLITSLFDAKTVITCLSICPHASWLAAFGLKSGLVNVVDLRKTGRILYKLRGHDKSVVSLTWCPVPINIFPQKPQNKVGATKVPELTDNSIENAENKGQEGKDVKAAADEIKDNAAEATESVKKEETGLISKEKCEYKPKLKDNLWGNLKFVDDEDTKGLVEKDSQQEKPRELFPTSQADDFLRECIELRNQILEMSSPEPTKTELTYSPEGTPRVILKARSKAKATETTEGKEVGENTSADNSNSSFDSAISSKKKTTDQSENDSSCDLNVTDSSKKSTDLSDVSFHSADDILDDKSVKKSENKENTEHKEDKVDKKENTITENSQASEVDEIVQALKLKFKEDKVKRDTDSCSVASDGSLAKREINVEQHYEIEEPRKEFLLASSAKEGSIYIWRAGTDGRLQTFFVVPNTKTYGKKPYNKFENVWITVCWIAPNMLLSSSKNGELLAWNLPKPKDVAKQYRVIHRDHWGLIFNLTGPITLLNDQNWLEEDRKLTAWSLGQDRMVINTDLGKEKTNLACYPTLGGTITCFAASPVDPNRLAMGTSDNEIRLWDLSREHTKRIVVTRFHNKIQSRVTCLAWHPVAEMSLAYGTLEGRVGIMDTNSQSKAPKLLPDFFQTQIYKIEWGPKPDCKDYCLYVNALGRVAIFDTKKDDKDPKVLDVPDNTVVYTFSWKPDYQMLLVSAKSGALIVYSADLSIEHIYYLHEKLCSIVWHPDACTEDTSVSKYSKVFASVVKNYQCVVYDLSIESEQNDDKILAKFDNKDTLITAISWSPHNGNHLVIADEDGVAQVYDIESKTLLATYTDPDFENILSIIWSPLDPDFLINGGISKMVVWKIADYPPIVLEEVQTKKKEVAKAQKKEQADLVPKEKVAEKEVKENKSEVLPVFYGVRAETQCNDIKKLMNYKEGVQSMEPIVGDSKSVDVLQIFGKNSDMMNLVDTNILKLRQRGKLVNSNVLTLWRGDISTEIKEAIEVKRVNPQLIVMCAIFAPTLLQNACEVYITQLMDRPDSDPIEIVTYLLACHKVEESIKVLCDNQLYKEALTLAKCRLPQDDPIILDILEKWAKNNVYVGQFEMAALCYITLGKFEDASSVLFRRTALELLELSAELAEKSGNQELHKAVMFRLNAFKNYSGGEGSENAPTVNGLSESPGCSRFKKIMESHEHEMLPADFVNELDYLKYFESQIFHRFIDEDHLYQLALANQGFMKQQRIQNILNKSISPKKNGD